MSDINWNDSAASSAAYVTLVRGFSNDPAIGLFSDDSRHRLAKFIVKELEQWDNPSIYLADNVTTKALRVSPYAAFGRDFINHIGTVVQKSLYPESWETA